MNTMAVARDGMTKRLGAQPEDQLPWTQYSFMPRPQLFMKLDLRWLDIAGWNAYDELNGYELSAPEALPAGCQAAGDAWFGVANVPREWEAHQRRREMVMERLTTGCAECIVSRSMTIW